MTLSPEKAEDLILGRALKSLREGIAPRVTQSDAADKADITLQAWQNYEAGKRRFNAALIDRVTRALGFAPDQLLEERDRLLDEPPPGAQAPRISLQRDRPQPRLEIPVYGRVRAGALGPNIYDDGVQEGSIDLAALLSSDARALRLAGESMIPYAEPGGFVVYHQNRWPRRGQGCIVETIEGDYFVKRYERTDGSTLFVTELFPEEKELKFELKNVKGVYAIALRGD